MSDSEEMASDIEETVRDAYSYVGQGSTEEDKRQKALMMKNRQINKEYKTWKQQSPLHYDLVISHALEWPSLTVEWLPDRHEPSGKDYCVQKLILGTYTTAEEPNYLMLVQVQIPLGDAENNVDESGQTDNKVILASC